MQTPRRECLEVTALRQECACLLDPQGGPAAGALCRKVRMGGEEEGDGSEVGDQTY